MNDLLDLKKKTSRVVWLIAILLATLVVYARTYDYGLVNWDDPLAGIDRYQETPDLENLKQLLRPNLSATYQPVRAIAIALLAPHGARGNWLPYHAVSLFFYLGTIVFVYLIAVLLIKRIRPGPDKSGLVAAAGLLAAVIFALHPSHAEAAAWVSGQKDVFVGFFYLGAFYFYIRRDGLYKTDLTLSALFYLLALGSKPSAVSLPVVLLAFDLIFRRENGTKELLRGRWPVYLFLFAPAIAAVIYFAGTTARVGAMWTGFDALWGKIVKFLAAYGFSALKLVLPVNLCLRYPGFDISADNPVIYMYSFSGAGLLFWTGRSLMRNPGLVSFLLCWFTAALLPNANLIRIQIERADRYYYLSSVAFAVLVAYGLLRLFEQNKQRRQFWIKLLGATAIVSLGFISWKQAGYWKDSLSAWSRVYALYPEMTLSKIGLATSYTRAGMYDEALRIYKPMLESARPNTQAIKGAIYISFRRQEEQKATELALIGHALDPSDEDFLTSLAEIYLTNEDTTAAEQIIESWLEQHPKSVVAAMNYAALLRLRGEDEKATKVYTQLVSSYSLKPGPMVELAVLHKANGEYAKAERLYLRALSTGGGIMETNLKLAALYEDWQKPDKAFEIYSGYELNGLSMRGLEFMGAHHFTTGDYTGALAHFQMMAQRDSSLPRAYSNSAVVLERMDRFTQADSLYQVAITLDSSYIDAWYNRGSLLKRLGRTREAINHFRQADSLAGGLDDTTLRALAESLVTEGDTAAAIEVVNRMKQKASSRNQSPGGGP